MFKVNKRIIRTNSGVFTYFTQFSSVSIVDSEQGNVSWVSFFIVNNKNIGLMADCGSS